MSTICLYTYRGKFDVFMLPCIISRYKMSTPLVGCWKFLKNVWKFLKKNLNKITLWLAISLLSICLKEPKSLFLRDVPLLVHWSQQESHMIRPHKTEVPNHASPSLPDVPFSLIHTHIHRERRTEEERDKEIERQTDGRDRHIETLQVITLKRK